ncbi:MAG: NAD-dependent epimerase/dehydratase family protein [Candidatus Liptonbacteria bacterium]|nr:NAD-dependent epimerase/dehydratase family protein [Candidatus Liptonbacteria bacterium]
MKILLTGASGYLGSLLIDSWLNDDRVEKIIAVDLKDPKFFDPHHPKVHFIKNNLADLDLEKVLAEFAPIDAVLHAAYLIRTPYFAADRKSQIRSNFVGAENAFKFALRNNVGKLIHFSTVAVYGALPKNNLLRPFTEKDDLNEESIAYGRDKKMIEKDLIELVQKYRSPAEVAVLRIGSVTGPFLTYRAQKRGLQSFFRGFLPFIPITSSESVRQFVHEDDIVSAINFCLFTNFGEKFLTFNLAPQGYLTFKEIAKTLGKRTLPIPQFLTSLVFWCLWHLSLGHVPTPPGVISSYSYPILVDGSKICSYGFRYEFNCLDSFLGLKGKFKNLKS